MSRQDTQTWFILSYTPHESLQTKVVNRCTDINTILIHIPLLWHQSKHKPYCHIVNYICNGWERRITKFIQVKFCRRTISYFLVIFIFKLTQVLEQKCLPIHLLLYIWWSLKCPATQTLRQLMYDSYSTSSKLLFFSLRIQLMWEQHNS